MKITRMVSCVAPLVMAATAHAEIAVVVSSKSAAPTMTKQQVSDLFLGKASTFPDGNQAIPVDQAEGQAGRDEFHGKFTGKSGAQLKAYWSKQVFSGKGTPPKELPSADEVKKLVAANPSTIGYVDKAAVYGSLKVVATP